MLQGLRVLWVLGVRGLGWFAGLEFRVAQDQERPEVVLH